MGKDGVVVIVDGKAQTLATFDKYNKSVVEKVKGVLRLGAGWVQAGAKLRVKNEKLRASIGIHEKSGGATQLIAPGGKRSIGGMVEHGIGAQGRSYTSGKPIYPSPVGDLKKWALRHGLNPYAVARNIHKRQGIGPKPFLQPAYLATMDAISREADRAIKDVTTEVNGKFPDSGSLTAGTRGGL